MVSFTELRPGSICNTLVSIALFNKLTSSTSLLDNLNIICDAPPAVIRFSYDQLGEAMGRRIRAGADLGRRYPCSHGVKFP